MPGGEMEHVPGTERWGCCSTGKQTVWHLTVMRVRVTGATNAAPHALSSQATSSFKLAGP